MAERLVERRYAPKQLILERGSRTEELAFICEGCVHICWALEDSCLAELRAGDMLGEVEVLSGADFKAFAVAAGRVETALLVISKADLEACLDQHQSVKLAVRATRPSAPRRWTAARASWRPTGVRTAFAC